MWALYARVSKEEQNLDNQINVLKDYALRHDYEPFTIYREHGVSGTKMSRPVFNRLIEDMREGLVTGILVYKIDRFGRNALHFRLLVEEMRKLKVEFVSATQPFIDIDSKAAAGKLMLNLFMALAEFESDLISERTKAGLARRKREGFAIGRPKGSKNKKRRSNK